MKRCRFLSALIILVTLSCLCSNTNVKASNIKINSEYHYLLIGESYQLKISGTTAKVKWKSDDKSIATVTSKGKIKGVSVGDTVVTATVGKKTFYCEVYVVDKFADYKVKISNGKVKLSFTPIYGYSTIQPVITFYDKSKKPVATIEFTNTLLCITGAEYIEDKHLPECNYDTYNVSFVVTIN